jgi:hypothetical protein
MNKIWNGCERMDIKKMEKTKPFMKKKSVKDVLVKKDHTEKPQKIPLKVVKKPDLYVYIKLIKNKPLRKVLSECDREGVRLWLDHHVSFPSEMTGDLNILRNSLYMALDFFVDREKRKDKPYLYDLVHMMKLFVAKSRIYLDSSPEWMRPNRDIFVSISLFFTHTVQLIQQSDTIEGTFIRTLLSIRLLPYVFAAKEEFFRSTIIHHESERIELPLDEFSFILLDILNYE